MANNTWSSGASTDWHTGANWSDASEPGAGDTAHFDATSVINCIASSAVTCDGIVAEHTYTGNLDFGSGTFTIGGNVRLRCDGGLDFGSITLNITGDLEFERWLTNTNALVVDLTAGPSIVVQGNLVIDINGVLGITLNASGADFSIEIQSDVLDEITGDGTLIWIKGIGDPEIKLTGSNPNIGFPCTGLGKVEVDGSGTLTLTKALDCEELLFTGIGTFTRDGNAVDTSGTLTIDCDMIWTPDTTGNVTANGGATINANKTLTFSGGEVEEDWTEDLAINGTVSVASGKTFRHLSAGLTLGAAGRITGNGSLLMHSATQVTRGVMTFPTGATIDIATLILRNWDPDGILAPGVYESSILIDDDDGNGSVQPSAGTYILTGNLTLQADEGAARTITLDNSNNPDIQVNGNLLVDQSGGTVTITAGTGTWTLGGTSGTQTIDFDAETIENLVIDSAGATKQLTGEVTCLSFTGTAGTFDLNGKTLAVTNNLNTASAFTIVSGDDAMNDCMITVGGDLRIIGLLGTPLNLQADAPANKWTLTVSGTGKIYYATIKNCDASGGSPVYCYNCTDGGGNINFIFMPNVGDLVDSLMGYLIKPLISQMVEA